MLKKRIAALAMCFILISTFSSIFASAANNATVFIGNAAETNADAEVDIETNVDANPETSTDENFDDNKTPGFFDKVLEFIKNIWDFIVWVFNRISLFLIGE